MHSPHRQDRPAEDRSHPADPPASLAVPRPALRRVPHLAAFFPDHRLLPAEAAPDGAVALVLERLEPAWRPGPAGALLACEAPWRAPRFGRRQAPVALVVAAHPDADADAVRLAIAAETGPPCDARDLDILALLREARVGGAPGLPDPGPAGLCLPAGEAILVLDPGRPTQATAARDMLEVALGASGGRPVLAALAPDAPPGARPVLPPVQGVRPLPGRLAPWTLVELAAEMHGLGADATELLALGAGVPLRTAPGAPWAGRDAAAVFRALAAATRCADPFRARPWPIEAAIRQLADWRVAEAEHRRIVACTGIEWFKLGRLRAALSHEHGAPRIHQRGSDAIRAARRLGGAVGVWAATAPPGLAPRCTASGIGLVRIEDGFIRSAGLGVLLAPAASLVLDASGIHYDPATPSALERLLARMTCDPALLARAAALRRALIASGVTKYNLAGAAPPLDLPPGRPVVLVAGQVEDDAAMQRAAGAIRSNLDLLRAVREAEPEAVILFKPHPDVESGMRRGAVPPAEARRLADRVLSGVPIGPLYAQVGAVHSIASLAGFEALLRGLRVVTWGMPFYAGWGLTEDRHPHPDPVPIPGALRQRWAPGAGAPLSLDALVAAALILYPRYRDPLTGLPCPPEVVVERLAETTALRRRQSSGGVVPVPIRALTARASRFLAGWWAAR